MATDSKLLVMTGPREACSFSGSVFKLDKQNRELTT